MKITFLGTAASIPTPTRGLPAILFDEDLLVDCGEGTSQKLLMTDSLENIKQVVITHSHLDHSAGIGSLIWSMWLHGREENLLVSGPPYIEDFIMSLLNLVKTPLKQLTFKIEYVATLKNIEFALTEHHPETYALKIERNGVSVCYSSDTAPCPSVIHLARGCDVLIHEATFPEEEAKLAHALRHSTPRDAGLTASQAKVKKLVLFHWSWHMEGKEKSLIRQAEQYFDGEVILAYDMQSLSL